MNSYLQNLVRRGAGLPLSSTAAPRPSHGFVSSVGTTEPLHEVATDEAAHHKTDSSSFQIAATSEFSPVVNRATQSMSPEQQLPTSPLIKPAASLDNSASSLGSTSRSASEHAEPMRTNAKPFESQRIEVLTKVRPVQSPESKGSEPPSNQEPPSQAIERPRVIAKAVSEAVPNSGEIPIVQMVRPADAERPTALQFPKIVSPQLPPEPVPIHVRVGRVEVRGGPTQTPARSTPATQAPLGFVRYHRMRRYRN